MGKDKVKFTFVFVFFFSTVSAMMLERDVLDILSHRPIVAAKCRATCMSETKSKDCHPIICKKCWSLCRQFSTIPREGSSPACSIEDAGCLLARNAMFGIDPKDKNRIQTKMTTTRRRQLKHELKFPDKPKFLVDQCQLSWSQPEMSSNSLLRRHRRPFLSADATPHPVFVVFGRDHVDRWYELGQTISTDFTLSTEIVDKMIELRVMAVTEEGVVDESRLTPLPCHKKVDVEGLSNHSAGIVASASIDKSNNNNFDNLVGKVNFQFPDPYFLPLVTMCILLGAACISVSLLILRLCRQAKSTTTTTFTNKGCDSKSDRIFYHNNNLRNASIEIFEDLDSSLVNALRISAASPVKTATTMSSNEDLKLKAHVCLEARCGLGPEYIYFVKNTNL